MNSVAPGFNTNKNLKKNTTADANTDAIANTGNETVANSEEGVCFHCGDVVPDSYKPANSMDPDGKAFCCEGCRGAHEIISGAGYENYYRFRAAYSPRPSARKHNVLEAHDELLALDAKGHKQGVFLLEGLHCASCVWLNEKVLRDFPGVLEAEVHLATGRAYLTWDPRVATLSEIGAGLARMGYRLLPFNESGETGELGASRDLFRRMVTAGFFAGNSMLVSISLYAGYLGVMDAHTRNYLHIVGFLLAAPVYFYSAMVFFRNAWAGLRNRTLTMDMLTTVGISLAFFYSIHVALTGTGEVYFDSVCFIVFFVLLGRYLEQNLRLKSLRYIENLRQLSPRFARVRGDGDEVKTIPASAVEPGMRVLLEEGERAPVDGLLLRGPVNLDESTLTGEFRPVLRNSGEVIAAGSRVLDGDLEMRAVSGAADGTLGRIEESARRGLRSLPRDAMAGASRWFIAFVLTAGVGVFWYWWGEGPREAIVNTIALLIVACPCALSLAVPSAYIVALRHAFRRGCLVGNGDALRALAKVEHLALDKTGTLTMGKPRLVRVEALDGSRDEALAMARSMQIASGIRHPLARAFLTADGGGKDLSEQYPDEQGLRVRYLPGRGILARMNGETWYLGSRFWMTELGLEEATPELELEDDLIQVYLGRRRGPRNKRSLIAVFLLEDAPRPEAEEAVREMAVFARPFMLTGDAAGPAEKAAVKFGIAEVLSRRSPQEKAEAISEKRKTGGVCMLGDGINDGIALARADCGITFANGAGTALGSADILLLGDDLRGAGFLFRLARSTRRTIRSNLAFAFAYNLILIPLAITGYLNPLAGALFMSVSSITVSLASLLIQRTR